MNIALAFGGGGLRCAAEIGVLRALERQNIQIECGAGTSFGSVVLGLYAMGLDLDFIADLFICGKIMNALLPAPPKIQMALMPFLTPIRRWRGEEWAGLFTGQKFRDFMNECVDYRPIEDARFPIAIVVTDLESQTVRSITSGDFGLAVQASSAVPGLLCPVRVEGSLCVDGGAIANLPIASAKSLARKSLAPRGTKVLAVDVNPYPDSRNRENWTAIQLIDQLLTTQLLSIDHSQSRFADAVVKPNHGVEQWLSRKRDEELIENAINIGERAAENVLAELVSTTKVAA
jgi:NTE family protein